MKRRQARLWLVIFAVLVWRGTLREDVQRAVNDLVMAFITPGRGRSGTGSSALTPASYAAELGMYRTGAKKANKLTANAFGAGILDVIAVPNAILEYQRWLMVAPLETKAVTSSLLFAVGDLISQLRSSHRVIDFKRLVNYMVIGLGSGILWAFWYGASQAWVTQLLSSSVMQVAASIVLEQFLWCPVLYSMYLIPLNKLLNGGDLRDVEKEVQQRLPGLLIANAKVWTLANVIIYNTPLEYRVLAANVVELVWANLCADFLSEEPQQPVSQPRKSSVTA